MKSHKKERIVWGGVLIASLILIAIMLGGCGSGGGGGIIPPGLTGDGVAITCLDAQTDQQAACRGLLEGISKPSWEVLAMSTFQTVLYNAGDIPTGTTIWAQAEVTNFLGINASVYFYTEFNKDGIFSNNTAQSYKKSIGPGGIINADYASNPCPDPGPCAMDGYYEYVTYVYNASHLAAGEIGDPSTDELLAVGVLMFTLVEGL